ncbi:hypothetical protein KHQ81_15350 (plasmid) [Mycoplasmatota bacterium]|nr:hypothetical protein KHQ81_15350 [Mycoplasmatota bacterium]
MTKNNDKSWVNEMCQDYNTNPYQIHKKSKIKKSTIYSAKNRGSRLNSAELIDKLEQAGFDTKKYR